MGTRPASAARILTACFLAVLVCALAVVFALSSKPGGFRGFFPLMSKAGILSLRTALAGVSLFTFFPLIWALYRRGSRENSPAWITWSAASVGLAESPALYGLVLFLVKGAFKTFFAFFAMSIFYLLIAWPRSHRK